MHAWVAGAGQKVLITDAPRMEISVATSAKLGILRYAYGYESWSLTLSPGYFKIGQQIGQVLVGLAGKYLKISSVLKVNDRPNPLDMFYRIEPTRLENAPELVADLVAELAAVSAKMGRSLHPLTAANLATVARIMNTFYSNLIEGHDTRPRDIERALAGEFDREPGRRNLQIEAASHIRVQAEIDRRAAEERLSESASEDFLRWLHQQFYRDAPEAMLHVTGAGREFTMALGEWRSRPEAGVLAD